MLLPKKRIKFQKPGLRVKKRLMFNLLIYTASSILSIRSCMSVNSARITFFAQNV